MASVRCRHHSGEWFKRRRQTTTPSFFVFLRFLRVLLLLFPDTDPGRLEFLSSSTPFSRPPFPGRLFGISPPTILTTPCSQAAALAVLADPTAIALTTTTSSSLPSPGPTHSRQRPASSRPTTVPIIATYAAQHTATHIRQGPAPVNTSKDLHLPNGSDARERAWTLDLAYWCVSLSQTHRYSPLVALKRDPSVRILNPRPENSLADYTISPLLSHAFPIWVQPYLSCTDPYSYCADATTVSTRLSASCARDPYPPFNFSNGQVAANFLLAPASHSPAGYHRLNAGRSYLSNNAGPQFSSPALRCDYPRVAIVPHTFAHTFPLLARPKAERS